MKTKHSRSTLGILLCALLLPVFAQASIKITPNCPNLDAVTQARFNTAPQVKHLPDVWWVKFGRLTFESRDWFVYVDLVNRQTGTTAIPYANSVLANVAVPPVEYERRQNYACVYNSAFDDTALIWISTSPTAPTLMGDVF
jgi:hypothetical protein